MNTAASLAWFKSSYSSNEGGNCVEVASHTSAIHVRDSKTPAGPMLTLSPSAWSDFLERLAC
ncbi:DUF397 domain-containing protein [Streptomyces sp. NPDC002677]|uniref:DUF397 domain-containing protein n=1 Tax=Streptomyces sp. NPDC002677 TaxID=3154774 RepID=UPI003321DA8F